MQRNGLGLEIEPSPVEAPGGNDNILNIALVSLRNTISDPFFCVGLRLLLLSFYGIKTPEADQLVANTSAIDSPELTVVLTGACRGGHQVRYHALFNPRIWI